MPCVQELSAPSLAKLLSFLFWSSLYLHSAISLPNNPPEWHSRLITFLHGSVATVIGLSQCGVMSLTPLRLNMKVSLSQYALMLWSWGYFAFDLLWCIVYQPEGRLILCHHTSALVGITLYMQKAYTGCTFACNLAMLEITNPLLQTRWFLKYSGHGKTVFFYIIDTVFVVMFFIVRGVFGTYILYKIINSKIFDLDEKIMSVVFYFVSLALIQDVVSYAIHKYHSEVSKIFRIDRMQSYITWESTLDSLSC